MKKSIVGTLALATMVLGMSAFKSADVAVVKSVDSTATMVDSIAVDSLVSLDSLKTFSVDSLQRLDSLKGFDSLQRVDSLTGIDSLQKVDSLTGTDSLQRIDSLTGIDSLQKVDSLQGVDSLKAIAVEGGSITGKISPADGAAEVEADNGTDKLKGAISQGAFTIPAAKAGTYTITILGKTPYKNAVIKDVKVEDGKATDLGEIKLEQ
ncbi:peptidase associated/transthyretin-like domain-containing protein [Chitinophaga arvensicola]|uniref:Carboxypeptidase regulatory-like domain-containing protein n=1 Tax=Chitinophaga arvensicola TaxID=29529 RepID=A0A1I0S637_9BACT|nr:carboxypeptidase regulatory-like domain-containing protein [Chitinophaga arvensicola]SEW50878.1 hypothetical protein SAMN04488122_3994 [Chitinophaga arvensicola]